MKKGKYMLLAILLCLIFQAEIVRGDIIYEPSDFFWHIHSEQCVYRNRSYIVMIGDILTAMEKRDGFRWRICIRYMTARPLKRSMRAG